MSNKTQWYEVLRKDGNKQYATKNDRGYLLGGTGFTIEKFDAVSVTEVDFVPQVYVQGVAYFDDGEKYDAVINKNERWNGWAMPYIHEKHIESLCKELTYDWGEDEGQTLTFKDGTLTIIENSCGELFTHHAHAEELFGETYYFLGQMGYTWNFDKK